MIKKTSLRKIKEKTCPFLFLLLQIVLLFVYSAKSEGASYRRKASEGNEVVKGKIYFKKKKYEISVPIGIILNQSYIQTSFLSLGGAYFPKEPWGFGIDLILANNQDKAERECIEHFYNDVNSEFPLSAPCGPPHLLQDDPQGYSNYGPAYVPIREIGTVLIANFIWSPVYGKQLLFMKATSYFDLVLEFGLGLVSSTYYPKQEKLRNGKISRGEFNPDGSNPDNSIGYYPNSNEPVSYGMEGRPDPENELSPVLNLAVGQKFHFTKKIHLSVYLKNLTILGSSTGFENLFLLAAGIGVRI